MTAGRVVAAALCLWATAGVPAAAQTQASACRSISACLAVDTDDDGDTLTVAASAGSVSVGSSEPTVESSPAVVVRCVALQPAGGEFFGESSHLSDAQMAARAQIAPSARVPGQMYALYCQRSDDPTRTWTLRQPLQVFAPAAAAPAPAPAPAEVLAVQAASQIALPAPTPATAPPREVVGLVGIATWLWVDPGAWVPVSATAAAGPAPVTCDGPGKPYLFHVPDDQQQTGCSYVFQWASDDHRHDTHGEDGDDVYHARASIVWAVTWTATTGETGTLADMTTTTGFDLTVGEIQAVVCADTALGDCNPTTSVG